MKHYKLLVYICQTFATTVLQCPIWLMGLLEALHNFFLHWNHVLIKLPLALGLCSSLWPSMFSASGKSSLRIPVLRLMFSLSSTCHKSSLRIQEKRETKRFALGEAHRVCNRASKCKWSKAQEVSSTCFGLQQIESRDVNWCEASCCFYELMFQPIHRWMKVNYFRHFLWVLTLSSQNDLTHLSHPLKQNIS